MILAMVALISLVSFWFFGTRGKLCRHWKGQEVRHFEREWEIKGDKQRVYFSVPSFKSAYFEMRPANALSRFLSKYRAFASTTIEKRFRFVTEEPHLATVLSQKTGTLDALLSLESYADFQILSTGNELHGWFKFAGKAAEAPIDRPEFQRALHALAPLLEIQFDLPLNEMKPGELAGWRRSQALPLAMTGSAILVWLFNELLIPQELIFQPSSSKVWLGLSLFTTGLGLFWGAIRVPPHYFLRTALAFVLLFSWSSFIWIYGVFTALNPIIAPGSVSLQCQLEVEMHGLTQTGYDCQMIDQGRTIQIPAHFIEVEWLKSAPQLQIDGQSGYFGQVFANRVVVSKTQPAKELGEHTVREGAPPTTAEEELPAPTTPAPNAIHVDEHMDLDLGLEAGLPSADGEE